MPETTPTTQNITILSFEQVYEVSRMRETITALEAENKALWSIVEAQKSQIHNLKNYSTDGQA